METSYDLQILNDTYDHLSKALDILWEADMENESAVRLRDELVAYLNPTTLHMCKVMSAIEKDQNK